MIYDAIKIILPVSFEIRCAVLKLIFHAFYVILIYFIYLYAQFDFWRKIMASNFFITLVFCLFSLILFNNDHVYGGEGAKMVNMDTSLGAIVIELDEKKAPDTVRNFIAYVQSGFYNGTIFHRVINDFMIQGGGFTSDMRQKEVGTPIKNEADNNLKNEKYSVAMARTADPHSASSQFFINVKDNDFLNHKDKTRSGWGYAVFGKVVKGTDVVDKIKAVPTVVRSGYADVPAEPILIINATVVE